MGDIGIISEGTEKIGTGKIKSLESELYDANLAVVSGAVAGLKSPQNISPQNTIERAVNKKAGIIKNYTGTGSVVGGLFFSGVGYAVGTMGSLVKDIAGYVCSELPKIPQYISNGIDHNTLQYFYDILGDSLARANYYGGFGAAVGLLGGTILTVKLKDSVSSFLRSISSIFKR